MFPLTRYFAITSLIAFLAGFFFLFIRVRGVDNNTLVDLREESNITLTRLYSNALLTDHGDFIMNAGNMTVDEIMSSSEFEALDIDIRRLADESTIIRVKIYAPNGLTVYSSEFSQIGEYKNDNAGFLAALAGDTASELVYSDTFNAFEGNIEAIDIVESYVAIQSSDSSEIQGVIEVYDDVTLLLNIINDRRTLVSTTLGTFLTILYILLFLLVRYAENILRTQHLQIQLNNQQLETKNTELNEANKRAEEATRLKSEFLSTMSHELRTPLNAIIGYSGIITSGISGDTDEKTLGMVQRIEDSGHHLLMLINNILDISKIESGRMMLVEDKSSIPEMTEALSKQLQILAAQKNLGFAINVDSTVPEFLIMDSERLKQVLINLLANAIKFTDKGEVALDMSWQSDTLTMKIRDTGIGISPHSIDYIFDEFRQVDSTSTRLHDGTGLGLAIVRKFTEAMKGTIAVESVVGSGSTFTVKLPLKSAE